MRNLVRISCVLRLSHQICILTNVLVSNLVPLRSVYIETVIVYQADIHQFGPYLCTMSWYVDTNETVVYGFSDVNTLRLDTNLMRVCVYSGLTSLSTIFQSYHDGVWLRQGAQCSLL